MKTFKLLIAVALFVTSVSFEEQVLMSDQGLVSNWELTIGTSNSFATEAFKEMAFE